MIVQGELLLERPEMFLMYLAVSEVHTVLRELSTQRVRAEVPQA